MLEYKVGDKVKVRALRSLENEFGIRCISLNAQRFCGKEATITEIKPYLNEFYFLDNSQIGFRETVFEGSNHEEG